MLNLKIKELAEKAEGTKKHVPSVWQFYDCELEEFAKLIISECVSAYATDQLGKTISAEELIQQRFGFD